MEISLSGTTDAQALPGQINQTHRKIREASADGAYGTRDCHDALLRKKVKPLIPPRSGAQYWPDKYHERHHAVANQHLSGSNEVWKKKVGYPRRSVAETAIFRIKTFLRLAENVLRHCPKIFKQVAPEKILRQLISTYRSMVLIY